MAKNSEARVLAAEIRNTMAIVIDLYEKHRMFLAEELLRFRHFRRYYFEMKYDWDKLEFLQKKFLELEVPMKTDFKHFLDAL